MTFRPLPCRTVPRVGALAVALLLVSLAPMPTASAGNPRETETTEIPEEAYELPKIPDGRNPKNRFGFQGGVTFGVKAKFVSEAFAGNNITAIKEIGPETVHVDASRGGADDNGGFNGEFYYERAFGESDLMSEGVNETWGMHFGVGFSQVDLRDRAKVNAFRPLDPADPPGTIPEFIDQGTMVHDLEADLWYVNVGLYKESYLTDHFYAKVGGGLSVAYIEGEYEMTGPFDFAAEYAEEEDILLGGYLDLTLGYDITRNWGLFGGIRYQYLTSFEMDTGYSEAELKFDQTFMAFLGLRFTF